MSAAPMKQVGSIHSALLQFGRLVERVHTAIVRGSFAAWGPRSRIGRGAKLVAPHLVQIGADVVMGEQVWLNAKDDRRDLLPTLTIGNGTYIGRLVQINAWRCVTIGENVLIADRVFISDADHVFAAADVPIKLQGDAFVGPVALHDGCWIGIGAVILPGVTIGRNAVVASNSVVTSDIPARTVAGGIPARIIKTLE
jgi:acetyltransferase-like isoleucine patch superfamily enzyme